MALLGARGPALLTTDEMSPDQFKEFQSGWIGYEVFLLREDGISESIAEMTARSEFEALRATQFRKRNASVLSNRLIRLQKRQAQ